MNILHIHITPAFISGSNNHYKKASFNNSVILIGEKRDLQNKDMLYYNSSVEDLNAIVELCNKNDMVILYCLNGENSYIANRIQKEIKVIWRFFGMELYGKMADYVYSDTTARILRKANSPLRKGVGRIKGLINKNINYDSEFEEAINRTDYFLGLSIEEYDFLKKHWPNLPPFKQLPYEQMEAKNIENKKKSNKILIGNGRSAYNNHIDILNIIEQDNAEHEYSFQLMFNYGYSPVYADKVRVKARKNHKINIIEELMPLDEYQLFFNSIDAFVLNSYRQMAMRAVFESLKAGAKVYLNKKNVMLEWLRKEGFLVFTISDFKEDLASQNLHLSNQQIASNSIVFEKFTQEYKLKDFHSTLVN